MTGMETSRQANPSLPIEDVGGIVQHGWTWGQAFGGFAIAAVAHGVGLVLWWARFGCIRCS